jgi:hypothetical protein
MTYIFPELPVELEFLLDGHSWSGICAKLHHIYRILLYPSVLHPGYWHLNYAELNHTEPYIEDTVRPYARHAVRAMIEAFGPSITDYTWERTFIDITDDLEAFFQARKFEGGTSC